MTLRTKSRSQQWTVWLCAALVSVGVYIVLSRILNGSVGSLLDPCQYRLAVPLLALFFYMAWNTRWDGVVRENEKVRSKSEEGRSKKAEERGVENRCRCRAEEDAGSADRLVDAKSSSRQNKDGTSLLSRGEDTAPTDAFTAAPAEDDGATGEVLFDQARALPHQPIPDFGRDGPYLKLLGKSAAKGYPRALAKLGEYAMRRAAWVEAYYWMTLAQRNGMHGLSSTLREIRTLWARADFPVQLSNVNEVFTAEAGSIGRALLCVDSGHEAAGAKDFLRTHYPDFLR